MRYLSLITALLVTLACVGSCRPTAHMPPPRPLPPPPAKVNAADPHPHLQLTGEDKLAAMHGPKAASILDEPMMRIRIGRSKKAATFTGSGSIIVGPGSADRSKARPYRFPAPLQIEHDGAGFVITQPTGKRIRWRLSTLMVRTDAGKVTINKDPYPGKAELFARATKAGKLDGTFDIVNHVGMESYLPGVLSQELYASWHPEAYRAQAIAARSYAIWEMQLPVRTNSHFDLEAGQASQAYIGDKASPKARAAVADTAGQVMVFQDRVLPAFYSSCTGGTGQDAAAAWPGRVADLMPLRGKHHGAWGQKSSKFRWGPVTVPTARLAAAIKRWGSIKKHPIANLQGLTSIHPDATNRVGRPTRYKITDARGKRYFLSAENLRIATNTPVPGDPPGAKYKVYSSHATYDIRAGKATIRGRGFGHGVGMCQFGAQQMSTRGYNHRSILGFYYPGAAVSKIY